MFKWVGSICRGVAFVGAASFRLEVSSTWDLGWRGDYYYWPSLSCHVDIESDNQ
jgi:hypothetical protein